MNFISIKSANAAFALSNNTSYTNDLNNLTNIYVNNNFEKRNQKIGTLEYLENEYLQIFKQPRTSLKAV